MTLERVVTLRQVFTSDLLLAVENEVSELRQHNLDRRELLLRLELLQERYHLNPPDPGEDSSAGPQSRSIVCSDGLV